MTQASFNANNPVYGDDDPIAAFATTPGNSALTLIRCSGKNSVDIIAKIFSQKKIKDAAGNTVIHGWIIDSEQLTENKKIDEVVLSVFRSPKSYTGEDCVDICCHGGFVAGKAVMSALKKAGFRAALPGEFTFRAFVNGKIDLTQCESVMEIVSAKTDTGRSR
ncbi:MAG: tRNA uridine-5-carboxymethylaminomethyl(34) synthesis GTPase MnmE, partial [Treponema sp.]|nr:tRNA uridine-5-carboxymethylaminomethyl(34) synthesis GTPase MnmE [Treponema sp.]